MNQPTQPKPLRQVIPLAQEVESDLNRINSMKSIDPEASLMKFLESNGFMTLYFQLGRYYKEKFSNIKLSNLVELAKQIKSGEVTVQFVEKDSQLMKIIEALITKISEA